MKTHNYYNRAYFNNHLWFYDTFNRIWFSIDRTTAFWNHPSTFWKAQYAAVYRSHPSEIIQAIYNIAFRNYPYLLEFLNYGGNVFVDNLTDPTGMAPESDNPVFGSNGRYRGNTKEGYTGDIIIYDGNRDFTKMTADELLYDNFDVGTQLGEGNTYDRVRDILSGDAKSKIWTHVASQMEEHQVYDEVFSMGDLEGNIVHFDNSIKSNWQSSYYLGMGRGKISGTDIYDYNSTVENLQSSIIVHEWYSHLKKNNSDQYKSHRLAYKNVINFKPLWNKTTNNYKWFNLNNLQKYTNDETKRTQVDAPYLRLYYKHMR